MLTIINIMTNIFFFTVYSYRAFSCSGPVFMPETDCAVSICAPILLDVQLVTRDLLQIEDSVLFSVHDHLSETFVAKIEYSEIFYGK